VYLSVYPNPTNGAFNVSFNVNNPTDIDLTLYNALGRILYAETYWIQSRGNCKFNLNSELNSSGIYYIKLKLDDKYLMKPITIVK
jgi:hypothetical protein